MKQIISVLTIIVFGFYFFKPETTNPNDIINSKNITIIIEHVGCFGGCTQIISIKEVNGKRMLTNNYKNGCDATEISIPFNQDKADILIELIKAGQSIPDSIYCTGQSSYNIKTEKYICSFQDNSCTLSHYIDKLLK